MPRAGARAGATGDAGGAAGGKVLVTVIPRRFPKSELFKFF